MIDSTTVETAKEGINLLVVAAGAVYSLVLFIAGRIHALRKKK